MPADLSRLATEHLLAMVAQLEREYVALALSYQDDDLELPDTLQGCLFDMLVMTEELARRGVEA